MAEKWRALGRAEMAADGDPRHEAVHAELQLRVPAALEHTGAAAFDSHLLGVQVGGLMSVRQPRRFATSRRPEPASI